MSHFASIHACGVTQNSDLKVPTFNPQRFQVRLHGWLLCFLLWLRGSRTAPSTGQSLEQSLHVCKRNVLRRLRKQIDARNTYSEQIFQYIQQSFQLHNDSFIFYLDVLPILRLQQTHVISFNSKWEIRAGNDVSPVASVRHWVSCLPGCTLMSNSISKSMPSVRFIFKHACTYSTEHSWWEQSWVGYLVDAFPHFKRQSPLPPLFILLFVYDTTLYTNQSRFPEKLKPPLAHY